MTIVTPPSSPLASATLDRLFSFTIAFDHPATRVIAIATVVLVGIGFLATWALGTAGKLSPSVRADLERRNRSWLVLVPLLGGPVLLGAAWTIFAVTLASLACYREFARATGLFRDKLESTTVVLGILAVGFASLDNWYGLFAALPALVICFLLAVPIVQDRPSGYVQRVGLGIMAFMIFGFGLGHLSFFANDSDFRPILLYLLFSVQLNDVAAYVIGKSLGRRRVAPNTSPNKTVAGSLGALLVTTTVAALLGSLVFRGGPLDTPGHLIALGVLISAGGQLGDLMLSSIKRDIGIKDMGSTFPGHGGLLDRLNSLLLVAPATFHYIHYVRGVATDEAVRVLSS